jgi:hypothetical protein
MTRQLTSEREHDWISVVGPRGSITFKGTLLGESSSHQDTHLQHANTYAARGQRCYACRWSEYQIFRVDELDPRTRVAFGTDYDGRYLVTSFGHTIVPNEELFRRVHATDSPAEVIELLTTRKFNQSPVITSAAARLLARVSDKDPDIQEAWDNRVVL